MKERLLTSLLAAIVITGLRAQTPSAPPKLVIGLTIDQLRTDYIEAFSAIYGQKGFKRLLKEGRIYYNAEYPLRKADASTSVATIYTGTTPSTHGISGNQWMERNNLRTVKSVEDKSFIGLYTSENSSPQRLLASTITDELVIATAGKSLVYSIAPTREMAILSAGHAANGALWLNDETGKWCGSTYYGSFPLWASQYNDTQALDLRIKKRTWYPSLPITSYKQLPFPINKQDFQYTFSDTKSEQYRKFKTSPLVNDEVNRLFEFLLTHSDIGKDNVPDMVTLSYYAGAYDNQSPANIPLEMQDTYVRLDKSLGELLELIERKVGFQHTLLFITGTPPTPEATLPDPKYRIPTGEFHIQRCTALLNMYLVAIYGQGQYVEATYDNELYLNRKLLEGKKINVAEIQRKAADFIASMSGVKAVYAAHDLTYGAWNPHIDKIRNQYNARNSGDIYIELLPGWSLLNEYNRPLNSSHEATLSVPVFFWGYPVKSGTVYTPISIGAVAPTVATSIRIRAPNAASATPLWDLFK